MTGYETEKCITDTRRKIKIVILTSLAIILCMGISFVYIRYTKGYQMFCVPEHDASAVSGVPDTPGNTYQELPVKEKYPFSAENMIMETAPSRYINITPVGFYVICMHQTCMQSQFTDYIRQTLVYTIHRVQYHKSR